MGDQVSEQTTNRLSLYLRFANELDANGVRTVSSKALAGQFEFNAALILWQYDKNYKPELGEGLAALGMEGEQC